MPQDLLKQLFIWGGIPGVVFGITVMQTKDFVLSILVALVTFIVNGVAVYLGQISGILKNDAAQASAKRIREDWQRLTGRYMPAYRTYLRNAFFNVDLGGVGEQNDYNIEMDSVFVELRVDTRPANQAETAAIPYELLSSSHTIWDFLNSPKLKRLAILGYPGSGKTTLMKHVAITLLDRHTHKPLKGVLPIFIELRRQHKFILETPDCKLIDVIVQSLSGDGLKPPPGWFEKYLNKGECLVMFDGLDEVGSSDERQSLIAWFDRMVSLPAYSQNQFIITSRPLGYRHNPSNRVNATLEVQPFSPEQQQQFINGWYLADEIKREAGKRSPRVQEAAQKLARALDIEIRQSEAFSDLAQNPLLITMIAIVYRQRQKLPENRAKLYAEICEVFLGKRWQARGIKLPLRAEQAQAVLQPLAFYMMQQNILELAEAGVLPILASPLADVTDDLLADRAFLEVFELRTGVLIAREKGIYSFAHKTFQEFLAAVHIHETKLEANLITALLEDPGSDWWHETARLYAAQSDASNLIRALLNHQPIQAALIALAIDCEGLAKRISDSSVRPALRSLLTEVAEDHDHPAWAAVAEALLRRRLTDVTIINDQTQVLNQPITYSDYQLFMDRSTENYRLTPFHWDEERIFQTGTAHKPITGLTPWQAQLVCKWLGTRQIRWHYRVPDKSIESVWTNHPKDKGCVNLMVHISTSVQPSWGRLAWLHLENLRLVHDLDLDLDGPLATALFRARNLDLDLISAIPSVIASAIASALDLASTLAIGPALYRASDLDLASVIANDLDADLRRGRGRGRAFDAYRARDVMKKIIQVYITAQSPEGIRVPMLRKAILLSLQLVLALLCHLRLHDLHAATNLPATLNHLAEFKADLMLVLEPGVYKGTTRREYKDEQEHWLAFRALVESMVQELEALEAGYREGQGPPEQLTLIRKPVERVEPENDLHLPF